jgi:hypothetical protein
MPKEEEEEEESIHFAAHFATPWTVLPGAAAPLPIRPPPPATPVVVECLSKFKILQKS